MMLCHRAAIAASCGISYSLFSSQPNGLSSSSYSDSLPRYTAAEVRRNDGTDGRPLWVTFRGSVHDVTHFQHPGGDFIRQAAGGDVEPFWKNWAYHLHGSVYRTKVCVYRDQCACPIRTSL